MVTVFMPTDCTKKHSNSAEDKTVYYKTDSIKELAARLAEREYNFTFRQLSGGFRKNSAGCFLPGEVSEKFRKPPRLKVSQWNFSARPLNKNKSAEFFRRRKINLKTKRPLYWNTPI